MKIDEARLERLRRTVRVSEMPNLDGVLIVSGPSDLSGTETHGTVLLTPCLKKMRPFGAIPFDAWVWRASASPLTGKQRDEIPDWPGINPGDSVTWGHLEALGYEVPEEI